MSILTKVPFEYCPSKDFILDLLLIATIPLPSDTVTDPVPVWIMSIEYPTGISTEEFAGRVTVIGLEEYKIAVLPTSLADKIKLSVFVITVPAFASLGSTSNLSSTEFQSIAFPARFEYSPVTPPTADEIAVFTYVCVARFAVFTIP